MRAIGKFVGTESASYVARDGKTVQQLSVSVLTTERELAVIRASGDFLAGLQSEIAGLKELDPVNIGCTNPQEFGGRVTWQHVASPVKG